ncbi:S-adenosyl-L-methionine-dependent methyltransferase [Atractiella rhizophila]|nr:S-adenosyl-L-methionine-dependent methyltransferase [Atractiella rhizophila]
MSKGKGKRRDFRPKNAGSKQEVDERGGWPSNRDTVNEDFERYYKSQGILSEEEWRAFMEAMRAPLPTSFRLSLARSVSKSLNERIATHFVESLKAIRFQGEQVQPPKQIPWYPEGFAWDFDLPKGKIKKNDQFQHFQSFMVHETDSGNMTRQEVVSMIPPLLLDVKPHHYVLDTCSAPGSKTSEILELLLRDNSLSSTPSIPAGLLIANDQSAPRCHMLVHQSLNRIPSPLMMVTNCDASLFPKLWIDKTVWNTRQEANGLPIVESSKEKIPLLFDRILCDVPCTGDGTARKNVNVWTDWKFSNAVVLHNFQLRILIRSFELLRPGGRVVYSTCSLNPIENEAVVSAALNLFPNSLRLVDVSSELVSLKRSPGMTEWKVFTPWGTEVKDMSDVEQGIKEGQGADMKGKIKYKMVPTMWPNGKEKERGLERCLRIYPHLQNTGGFFVAVLEKVQEASEASVAAACAAVPEVSADDQAEVHLAENKDTQAAMEGIEEAASVAGSSKIGSKRISAEVDSLSEPIDEPPLKKTKIEAKPKQNKQDRGSDGYNEEPFSYLSSASEQVQNIINFYQLPADFPRTEFLVRNGDPESPNARNIYFTSPIVRHILTINTFQKLRLISCGLKAFSKSSQDKGQVKCQWRLQSEGIPSLKPFLSSSNRVLKVDKKSFELLMSKIAVTIAQVDDDAVRTKVDQLESGSMVIECDGPWAEGEADGETISLPAWKSKTNFSLMVDKKEKSALSLRIYGEDKTPHAPKAKNKWKSQETTTDLPSSSATVTDAAI